MRLEQKNLDRLAWCYNDTNGNVVSFKDMIMAKPVSKSLRKATPLGLTPMALSLAACGSGGEDSNSSPNNDIDLPTTGGSDENVANGGVSTKYDFNSYTSIKTPLPLYRSHSIMGDDQSYGDFPGAEIRDVGDINKDGIDDIVIEYFENATAPVVMLGTQNGLFERLSYDIGDVTRRHIRNGELEDVDGEGWLDFVGFTTGDAGWRWELAGWTTNGVEIPQGEADLLLINQEGEGFIVISIPQVSENDYNHGGTIVDIDGDGLLDIATVREGSDEWTAPIINNGNLIFTMSEIEYSSEVSYYGTSEVEAGDLNKDGHNDLVFTIQESYDPSIENSNEIGSILVIMGDGDFDFSNNYSFKFGGTWITSADRDVILSKFIGEAIPNSPWVDINELVVGSGALKLFDLDGDGDLDLFEGQYYSVKGLWRGAGFKYYENVGVSDKVLLENNELFLPAFVDKTDTFFPNQEINRRLIEDEAPGFIFDFWFGDINDDGLVDLVLQNENANGDDLFDTYPYIFLNNGNGVFLPLAENFWPAADNLANLVIGNFDGDPGVELLGIRELYGENSLDLVVFL